MKVWFVLKWNKQTGLDLSNHIFHLSQMLQFKLVEVGFTGSTSCMSVRNVKRLCTWLHTWDGVEGSAVIMVGQKRHCLCLGPLRLSNTTQADSHTTADSHTLMSSHIDPLYWIWLQRIVLLIALHVNTIKYLTQNISKCKFKLCYNFSNDAEYVWQPGILINNC